MNLQLQELIERARKIQMTPADVESQRRSFAFGNANIENDQVTRDVIDPAAEELEEAHRAEATCSSR